MSRHGLLAVLTALAGILVFAGAATSGISSHFYEVHEPELRTSGESVYYAIDDFGSSTTPHYPVLPTRKVNFEIPYAATDVLVTITPGQRRVLGVHPNYLMRQPPMLLGDPTYQPPPAPEQIPDLIPAVTYRYTGEREFRGHRMVEIVLAPIQYASSGEITFVSSYSIDVSYSMAVSVQASEDMALSRRSRSFEPLAAQIIENYYEMNDPHAADSPPAPLYDLSNPQYAIITTPTFEAHAETLAAWKTRKGVPTEVYMLSWIETNFTGTDTQEKIRNFLRLDDSTPKFDYVLLLGDTNTIPCRYCRAMEDVPCDYYFSDVVDGAIGAAYDWDTDNDGRYGEINDDVVTWLPDTYVGRIASRSATEVGTIVANILDYEKNPPAGSWPKKAVFGAAFANFVEPGYDPTDMATVAEWVRGDFLDPASVTYDRLYEAAGIHPTSYAYDYPVTATNFETRVGLGCGFAFPSGHGNYYGNYRLVWAWDDGDGYYQDDEGEWYDLSTKDYNPSTGGEKPFVLVGACLSGEMDRTSPCLGDFIVANWGIGAVASSRTSYYCVGWDDPDWPWNQGQEYRWWEEIWSNGKYRMGQIHGDNKYHYAMDFNSLWDGDYGPDNDEASRKNMFSSNLFGDPELPVWTDSPTSIVVVHNSTLPTGPTTFDVTVTSGGPLADATVCLWKGSEVYMVEETNGSGVASFSVSAATTGEMQVTVTKHNYIPYEGSATVQDTGDTEDPDVTVTQPNGGENWAVDSFFDIMWTATDNVGVTSIDILLSSDGGATYPHTIATGEANDGVFNWLVDVAPTTQARVKVIAYDAAMNSGEDESDADFTIADGTDPDVTMTQPNGGENWAVDSFFDITWTATDNIGVTSIDILLSSDGGATYPHTIATGEANDGVFNWLVDVAPTTQARVKVIAYDAAMNSGEDESDADFTIADGTDPDVTVTQPNGGENWAVDSFFDITWTATDNIGVTSIDIVLSSDGGATYPHAIATGETNDGVFNWLVDVAPTTQARVKVIAYDAAMNSGEDESDADFTIADGEDPEVTVIDPNGGENWAVDSFFDITWNATDNIGVTSIDIVLSSDGGATYPHTIATGEANDGVFNWLVDVAPTTQARVKVIAYDAAMNSGEDESDADFAIADGEDPEVTVIAPNGGENWAVDSFFDITWNATDNIGVTSIDIVLSSDGGATYPHTIATGETNDGVFNWLVDVAPTTQARVKVIAYDAAMNSGEDESDADFAIADGEDPEVTVIAPNGGEVWDIDSFFDITWNATDNIGVTSIDIVLSLNGGGTFPHTIATGEVNDGLYEWLVDSPASEFARVKVIAHDAGGNNGEDVSDADFEVYDPTSGVSREGEKPARLVIAGATPNPFSKHTSIRFGIPVDGQVLLEAYDVAGRQVARLADGHYTAGYHSVEWTGANQVAGTGLYFLRLRSQNEDVTYKIVISR